MAQILRFRPDTLLRRVLVSGLAAGPLVCAAVAGASQVDDARRSVLEYARWAEQVLAAPPGDIELLPALEDRLAEKVEDQRREMS